MQRHSDRQYVSLNFEQLETPELAFIREMPQDMLSAIGHRLFWL